MAGEIAVIGLAKSGRAAGELLRREGARVYASDAGSGELALRGAAALRAAGAEAETGGHDLDRIARASVVVASPGVPPDAPPLARARAAGVPIVSEVEVALRALPQTRAIAVTGTNGKTTTTAMIAHLLRAVGADAAEAGNIGTPVSELALAARPPAWLALELSSFQLHDTPGIAPAVGVLTNLSPDHLDRYADVRDYYADKALLFRNATAESRWVLNGDQPAVLEMTHGVAGRRLHFSLGDRSADAWLDRASGPAGALTVNGERLMGREELGLYGDHNVANALAAALAVWSADAGFQDAGRLADGLRTFRPLAHRLEPVGEFDGVLWINDSKATNVSSTLVAVEGMQRPTVLLLGGRHKGEPYTALAEPLRRAGRAVIAYGEAAELVERDLNGVVPLERLGSSFDEVIARARALARPGDAVLLSPACSSYDMFRNYEHRGAEFTRLAVHR